MSKRNRRHKMNSTITPKMGVVVVVILFLIAPWVIYSYYSLSVDQVANEVKRLEQTAREQKAALVRVSAVWNQMMEPARLNEAISRHGLAMSAPTPDRQVRVNSTTNTLVMNPKLKHELAQVRNKQNQEVVATTTSQQVTRSRSRSRK